MSEEPKYLVYFACYSPDIAKQIQKDIVDSTGYLVTVGITKDVSKSTHEKLKQLYWKIRKNYPLTSWHNPKSPFEQTMQEVLIEFGEIIRE